MNIISNKFIYPLLFFYQKVLTGPQGQALTYGPGQYPAIVTLPFSFYQKGCLPVQSCETVDTDFFQTVSGQMDLTESRTAFKDISADLL